MEFLAYLTALSLIGIVSPGPDFVAVSQACLRKDDNKKINLFIAGIAIGNGFWVFTALLGIERVFHNYPESLSILKFAGGIYLCYLGLKSFGYIKSKTIDGELSLYGGVHKGLLVTLSNPKAALFYFAILSSNLPDEMDYMIFLLIVTVTLAAFVWFVFISSLLQYKHIFKVYKSNEVIVSKFFGVLFLYFGGYQIIKAFID